MTSGEGYSTFSVVVWWLAILVCWCSRKATTLSSSTSPASEPTLEGLPATNIAKGRRDESFRANMAAALTKLSWALYIFAVTIFYLCAYMAFTKWAIEVSLLPELFHKNFFKIFYSIKKSRSSIFISFAQVSNLCTYSCCFNEAFLRSIYVIPSNHTLSLRLYGVYTKYKIQLPLLPELFHKNFAKI